MATNDLPTTNEPPRRARRRTARAALVGLAAAGIVGGSVGLAGAASGRGSSSAGNKAHHSAGRHETRVHAGAGSTPVDVGYAQVAPGKGWTVVAQLGCPMRTTTGNVLFVDEQPSGSKGCTTLPKTGPSTSIVWLFPSSAAGKGKPVAVLNGFDAYAAGHGAATGYLVPQLGIELLWEGGKPAGLLHTLGWSPLHYVLTEGSAAAPSSWTRHSFDGVSLLAPPSWPIYQPLVLKCSYPFESGPAVGLGIKVIPLPCPYIPPSTVPVNGILITPKSELSDCPIKATLTVAGQKATVCSDPSVEPGELQVELTQGSGATANTTYVTLGLGTNPIVARELLGGLISLVP